MSCMLQRESYNICGRGGGEEMEWRGREGKVREAMTTEEIVFYGTFNSLQYRHLVPAPVDRTSASAWLYKNHE